MSPYKANLIRASSETLSDSPSSSSSEVASTTSATATSTSATPAAAITSLLSRPLLPPLPAGHVFYATSNGVPRKVNTGTGEMIDCMQRVSQPTLSTMALILQKQRWSRGSAQVNAIYYDQFSPNHGWLLEGWLAELRISVSGSSYWIYYDPSANRYRSKAEVRRALQAHGRA